VNRITQNKDNIVIQYGQMGLKRTVYMNMKQHPANVKPSRAGHSIGHWEGDVLVVDTVGFLPACSISQSSTATSCTSWSASRSIRRRCA
jgi:hypothetical protein